MPSLMPGDTTGRTALLVDDDPFFRLALGTILTERLGCSEIVEASSFDEAVERLSERQNISIAIFDLAMTGMSSPANLRKWFPSTMVCRCPAVTP